jgi:hypothetical protein
LAVNNGNEEQYHVNNIYYAWEEELRNMEGRVMFLE